MSPLYIISSSCISPQNTFKSADLEFVTQSTETNMLLCIEPDFAKYINPVQIRRMSRALKIGYTAAIECLNHHPTIIADSIIIGTGKGCLTDTEQFLHSIRDYNETSLNATPFIHSTYNQLNGMIALNKKVSSYNMTYVHRGFSFEHSLMDAALLFVENDGETSLVGSFDEMTAEHFLVKKHWGYWKKENIKSQDLLLSQTEGTISGEGSAFFLLNKNKPDSPSVAITHVTTLFRPSKEEVELAITELLACHSLKFEDIDILFSGQNGDIKFTSSYQYIEQLFIESQILYFKHLCGEYDTATSFACWIASKVLETQSIPEYLFHPNDMGLLKPKTIRHILVYNNYFDLNQSLMLLSLVQ